MDALNPHPLPPRVPVIRWQQRAALRPSLERSLHGTECRAGRPAELKDQGSAGVRGQEERPRLPNRLASWETSD